MGSELHNGFRARPHGRRLLAEDRHLQRSNDSELSYDMLQNRGGT